MSFHLPPLNAHATLDAQTNHVEYNQRITLTPPAALVPATPYDSYEVARQFLRTRSLPPRSPSIEQPLPPLARSRSVVDEPIDRISLRPGDCYLRGTWSPKKTKRPRPGRSKDIVDSLNQYRPGRQSMVYRSCRTPVRRSSSSAHEMTAEDIQAYANHDFIRTKSLIATMTTDLSDLGLTLYSEDESWERLRLETVKLDKNSKPQKARADVLKQLEKESCFDSSSSEDEGVPSESLIPEIPTSTADLARTQYLTELCEIKVEKNTCKAPPEEERVSPRSLLSPEALERQCEDSMPRAVTTDPKKFVYDCYHEASGIAQVIARGWISTPDSVLESVTVCGNGIDGLAAVALLEAARHLPSLKHLNLSNNRLNKVVGLAAALEGLSREVKTLETLDLTNTQLEDSTIAQLARALNAAPKLTILKLARNNCFIEGAQALGMMLSQQFGLRELHLAYNRIGTHLELLSAGLSNHCTLELLDVSWNCVDDAGAIGLSGTLRQNKTLTKINLSHNRILEQGAVVLMDVLKTTNRTLTELSLSANNLGQLGGRAAVAVMDNKGLPCKVLMHNCSFRSLVAVKGYDGEGAVFDPDEPNGYYDLELMKPYDCTIAKMVVEMAYNSSADNMRDLKFNDAPMTLPRESRWKVPNEGTLRFNYVHTYRRPKYADAVSEDVIQQLMNMLGTCLESEKMEMLALRSAEYWFTAKQVPQLLQKFTFSSDKIEVCRSLFHRIVDPQSAKAIFPTVFSTEELKQLKMLLGQLWYFNWNNCTGQYILRFDEENDRQVMRQLLAVSADEGRERIRLGLPDISQKGNNEGFRNERLNKDPITLSSTCWTTPVDGQFMTDFVSYIRPPGCADEMPDEYFDQWLAEVKLQADEFIKSEPPAPAEAAEAEGEQASATQKPSKKGKKEEVVEEEAPDDLLSPSERVFIGWVQEQSTLDCPSSDDTDKRFLTAEQLSRLLLSVPHHLRVELFVVLWGRLIDEECSGIAFKVLDAEQYLQCFKRLGVMQLFNPLTPEGPYRLDLGLSEDNMLGRLLLKLALREPGDNVQNEMYRGMGFETPVTWLTDFPEVQTWSFTYVTNPWDKPSWPFPTTADPIFRKQMAIDDLGWEFDDDDDAETLDADLHTLTHNLEI